MPKTPAMYGFNNSFNLQVKSKFTASKLIVCRNVRLKFCNHFKVSKYFKRLRKFCVLLTSSAGAKAIKSPAVYGLKSFMFKVGR